jgi:putative transposase
MPRRTRITTPDLIRHVVSRGNAKMTVFLDDTDYRQFIFLLGDVSEEFGIHCWNYCLMPNHYHLTLQPGRPNLSEAMRRLNGNYGLWWNRRHRRVGHVFQGRFKDQIVDRDSYIFVVTRYVLMNPVRANLVRQPADWRWSSYRAMAGLTEPPPFLTPSLTLRLFGDGAEADLRRRFTTFVSAVEDDPARVDRIRSGEVVLGPRGFKEKVA